MYIIRLHTIIEVYYTYKANAWYNIRKEAGEDLRIPSAQLGSTGQLWVDAIHLYPISMYTLVVPRRFLRFQKLIKLIKFVFCGNL